MGESPRRATGAALSSSSPDGRCDIAGAVDLFAGSKSVTGANLFTVDKNPLNQLFEGVDDVIGKQAGNLGANMVTGVLSYVQKIAGAIIDAILGLPLELLSSLEPALLQSFLNVDKFFTNILGFLGGIDPLSELFSIETAAQNFINNILAETGLLPILDGAGHLAAEVIQPLIDAIAAAFGLPTGLDFVALEIALANFITADILAIINGWKAALDALHLSSPTALVQQIPQSIPALVRDIEGGLSAVGSGLTRGIDGAIHYVEDGLTHLVQQADQGVLGLAQITQQLLHVTAAVSAPGGGGAAAVVANPGVADVMLAGQSAHTALTSAIEQVGATVENDIVAGAAQLGNAAGAGQVANTALINAITAAGVTIEHDIVAGAAQLGGVVSDTVAVASGAVGQIESAANVFAGGLVTGVGQLENAVAGFFTNLFNSWTGATVSGASAHDVAVIAAAASKTIAESHTVSIETISLQLPSFYGGGGAGGLAKSVSMSGTLPAGFTSESTIAVGGAVYNTVATTDTQTVSGAWSVTDTHAQYLFLRGNSGLTTYVYAKLQSNTPFTGAGNCEIGCVVAGVRHVFSTFALPGNFIAGSVYSLAAVSNVFTVTGPGGLDATYTDSGVVSQVGSSYRYGGFGTDGYSREIDSWSAAGSTSYTAPAWMASTDTFDFVGVGGGGGGGAATGSVGHLGYGGVAGTWFSATVSKSTVTGSITVAVGAAGLAGGTGGYGGPGGSSAVVAPGYGTITGVGGAGGPIGSSSLVSDGTGKSPGNTTLNNAGYTGGAEVQPFFAGAAPGGAGGGGETLYPANTPPALPGRSGAPGAVWITANDLSSPGSLGFWAFYDSAVTGPAPAYVATSQSTSSATYTDLATTHQVTVTIGSSGMALVFITATMGAGGSMSFAASGTNTIAAADTRCISAAGSLGAPFLLDSLTAGATTFTAKHKSASGSVSFQDRRIAVIPL